MPRFWMVPLLTLALASGAVAQAPWIELEAPGDAAEARSAIAWLAVGGRAGVGEERGHDVVVALDLSASTWLASGVDA